MAEGRALIYDLYISAPISTHKRATVGGNTTKLSPSVDPWHFGRCPMTVDNVKRKVNYPSLQTSLDRILTWSSEG